MSQYLGDYYASGFLHLHFNTKDVDGNPFTLAGSPIVDVSIDGAPYLAGGSGDGNMTITVDSPGTGSNYVLISLGWLASFVSTGSHVSIFLAAGTVDGLSVAHQCIGRFTIKASAALRPSVDGRNINLDAGGQVSEVSLVTDLANGVIDSAAIDGSALTVIRSGFCLVSDTLNAPTVTARSVTLNGIYGVGANALRGTKLLLFNSGGEFIQGRNIVSSSDDGVKTTVVVDRDFNPAPQDGETSRVYENDGAALLATDLIVRLAKNTAFANFPFKMVSSTDHVTPATGLTVTAQRSIDGGSFANCANAVTEISAGVYKISLAAADLNGDAIALKFTATGADQVDITVLTQPGVS